METIDQPAHRIEDARGPLWFGSGPVGWGDVVRAVDPDAPVVTSGPATTDSPPSADVPTNLDEKVTESVIVSFPAPTGSSIRNLNGRLSPGASASLSVTPSTRSSKAPLHSGGSLLAATPASRVTVTCSQSCSSPPSASHSSPAARRSGRDLPEHPAAGDLVLMGVASHKISRLVSKDKVAAFARAPFTEFQEKGGPAEVEERARGTGLRRAVGELLVCPYCLGLWVSAGLHLGLVFAPRTTRFLAAVFGSLTISDFLQIGYRAAEDRGLGGS